MSIVIKKITEKYNKKGRGKSIIYFSPLNETISENLLKRRNRPVEDYKEMIPEILGYLGYPKDAEMKWSQKAGCNCGCSPGFVFKCHYGKDISVEYRQEISRMELSE